MRNPRPSSGHALVGTMGFLILAMLLWAAAFAHATGCMRTLKACQLRADGVRPTRALAWGLALLETGRPPVSPSPYSCLAQVDANSDYVLTFQKTSWMHFTVSVRPAVPADSELPRAPSRLPR